MAKQKTLRIATRGSALARWQADWVADCLRRRGHTVEIIEIATRGDADQSNPIGDIGSPGVFTKEIQRAVLAGEADVAVHSLKDLPTDAVAGLVLAAVPARESAADVLVSTAASSFDALRKGARIGTGSLRRQAQLRHARPDFEVMAIRGNVDTRLRKLDEGQVDALVLAEAGLQRLGWAGRISQVLPWEIMLPAVGQGALGIECRANDVPARAALAELDNAATHAAVVAERTLLARLRGGCLAPIGALGLVANGRLELSAVVLSPDGVKRLEERDFASPEQAEQLGCRVADALLSRGAGELIAAGRSA
ncbi:MAG TPA: hydroxymethylbilane synthase [Lacipirellulaceae bacterium]|jgi:hydroxymethylbilane synthase